MPVDVRLLKTCVEQYRRTQKQISEQTGTPRATLCRKLNGKAPMLLEDAVKILDAVGIREPYAICEICGFVTTETEEKENEY